MPITFISPLFLLIWLCIPVIWIMMHRASIRYPARSQRWITGGLRSLLIVIVGLTLAEPQWEGNSDQVNLFFVLDASDSIQEPGSAIAQEYMKQAVAGMSAEDQAGLIVFGKKPFLELPLKNDFVFEAYHSQINSNFTNIYEAIQLAIGKLPEEGTNRILLISDGNQNINQAEEMSFLANSLGIEIFSLPLDAWQDKNEVFLEKLDTPPQVTLESPFEIHITVDSTRESESDLILLRNGTLIANHRVSLQAGTNIFRLVDTIPRAGIYSYQTLINPDEDVIYQNNEGLSFTYATRKSGILHLSDSGESAIPLVMALREQGFHVDAMPVIDIPDSLNDILDYKAIILDNVPGSKLSEQTMENLEKYVKDIGGGLLMIGGDKSFGAGDYRKTLVEKALPVLMDIPTEMVYSSLSIVFVIDKSNSMIKTLRTQNKLEAAKIAVFSAVELLNPNDKVGVIAFDAVYHWAVPFIFAKNRQTIANQLQTLHADGGTKLYEGLKEAIQSISQHVSAKKHVIILSDGQIFDDNTEKDQLDVLIQSAIKDKITVSTVAVGDEAEIAFMESMADQGKGRSYVTNDAGNIPRIFVDEINIVARKVILEKELKPETEVFTELTEGYANDFPLIYGMDITHPKPGAIVQLKTEEGPLLITKRYGLGKSLAFTSDLSGRWGKNWLHWDHYGKFVGQMVKWVEKQETSGKYSVSIERMGDEGNFLVDVMDESDHFINALDLKLNILFPDKSKSHQAVSLEQISPGKYKGTFPVEETGAYYLNLFEQQNETVANSQTFGYGIPYTNEFQNLKINLPLLKRLAENTNGRLLNPEEDLAPLFMANSDHTEYGVPLWPYFLIMSTLLLLVDVAVRKFYEIGRTRPRLL